MPERTLNIPFPLAGLDRTTAYQRQPPYSTPDSVNVRPDSSDERMRGGSRPGLQKAYPQLLGAGGPVRMISEVRSVAKQELASWSDAFDSATPGIEVDLGPPWGLAPWSSNEIMRKTGGTAFHPIVQPDRIAIRDKLVGMDATRLYSITLRMVPNPFAPSFLGAIEIFAALNDSAPNFNQDGISARIAFNNTNNVIGGAVTVMIAGVATPYPITPANIGGGVRDFVMQINGLAAQVKWGDATLLNQNLLAVPSGSRIGFRFSSANETLDAFQRADDIIINYSSTVFGRINRNYLIASAGGALYREDFNSPDDLVTVPTTVTLRLDANINAAERAGLSYVADYDTKAIADDGTVTFGNRLASASDIPNFLTLPGGRVTTPATDVVVIFGVAGGTVAGTYKITSATAGQIILATSPGDGTCSFRIERGVKVYDPVDDSLKILVATVGQVPQGNPVISLYRDRLVFAGALHSPHVWYMSRQGDPLDWNYGASSGDPRRAVAGTSADAGEMPEPIHAGIPYSDDYFLFGCLNSLWVLRGDPAYGGQIDNVSYTVGVIDKNAWCHGPSGEVYFLSRDGLYALAPGAGSTPEAMSRLRMPRELIGIDITQFDTAMAYDIVRRGIHIYVTPRDVNVDGRHFWFDFDAKSFWPYAFGGLRNPTTCYAFDSDVPSNSAVLLGGRNGFLYKYVDGSSSDDGEAFNSYVLLGPFRTSGEDYLDGVIQEISAVLASTSGTVIWSIYARPSDEEAVNAATIGDATFASAFGSWTIAGLNYRTHQRARGNSFVVRIEGLPSPWALERITVGVKKAGRQRVLS